MATVSTLNYIDTVDTSFTGLSEEEVDMGIEYKNGYWDIAVWYRVGAVVKRLRGRVRGGKRETKAEAVRLLHDLGERARMLAGGAAVAPPATHTVLPQTVTQQPVIGSLTFGDGVNKYLKFNPQLKQDIITTLRFLNSELGHVELSDFRDVFMDWLGKQSNRNRRAWRIVDGVKKLCEIEGKKISPATLQKYKRYVKAILRMSGHGEVFDGIKVGAAKVRRQAISNEEMAALEGAVLELFPWFFPAFDMMRSNPIRPGDLFSLTADNIVDGQIVYIPQKTGKGGRRAFPIIWPHFAVWFNSLPRDGLLFPRPGGKSLLNKDGTNGYYRYVWDKIRKKAGLPHVQFYDLKHYSVDWLLSRVGPDGVGIDPGRIVQAAGWSTTAMLDTYRTDNLDLVREYDRQKFAT